MIQASLDGTWMVEPRRRRKLNHVVNQRLQAFLGERTAPQSVDALCGDLQNQLKAGLFFSATATCAMVGELLLGSEEGGIFPNKSVLESAAAHGKRRAQRDWLVLTSCLRALRDACFHPACVTGRYPLEELIGALRQRGDWRGFADKLARDHSALRTEEMTGIAVRLLAEVGREVLERV